MGFFDEEDGEGEIGEEGFNEVMGKGCFLVFLFNYWCESCHQSYPAWQEFFEERRGNAPRLFFVPIDIEAGFGPAAARKLRAKNIPHLALVCDGDILGHREGGFSIEDLREFVTKSLKKKTD